MKFKCTGLTFIELMITVAIVAIAAAVSIPQYYNYIEDTRLRDAATELQTKLSQARSEAIKLNIDVNLVITTGSSWCLGITSTASCDCNTAGQCNLGVVSSANYPLTSLSQTGLGATNSIESNRGTLNTAGSVVVSLSGKTVTVEVNRMGFTNICSSSIAGYRPC